jgi:hypothetical protein
MMTAGVIAVGLCFAATGLMLTIVSGAIKKSPLN